jgi:hypothetical protein
LYQLCSYGCFAENLRGEKKESKGVHPFKFPQI